MRAYFINAIARTIEPFDWTPGASIRDKLPGGLDIGYVFPNGDVLYVDDEALLRKAEMAFRILPRADGQPMMCHGVLTGRDHGDETLPPRFTPDQLASQIAWMTVDEALAWFRAKADQPAVTSQDGLGRIEVHAMWGALLANLEGKHGYRPDEDEGLISKL
jgi:hypothetical protein